ncbi:FecR family protein [Snuella lapsa]|uniref:DUF4974 domain-containing protein n=1 Tax=Snuella lapsa TaxID=870481 RepID=A0ABP6Y282_9FLAO
MSDEIEKIVVKFLTNGANEKELEKLADWLKTKDNVLSFDRFVKINYALDMNLNEFNSENVKIALMKKKRQDRSTIFKLKIRKIIRYAAAAIIIFGLGYFFRDNIFNAPNETAPVIVDTNKSIEPGSDNAILMLEDGSQIALGNGKSFQNQNANSNGEQIVYKKEGGKTKEVKYNYLTIPRGGQFNLVLSDGTEVWLNSESQFKYPVSFIDGEIREVELVYGEAYFDVSPSSEHNGTKFKVHNSFQDIEVYGTEFNVKAYKDEFNVYTTLVEGKVDVEVGDTKQSLVPNEQSNLNIKTMSIDVAVVDVEDVVSWKNGIFSFKGKPLKDIMKVISRWYDIDVIFENKQLETITFKGVLGKDQNIEEILMTIKTLSVLKEYEIVDKTVILK